LTRLEPRRLFGIVNWTSQRALGQVSRGGSVLIGALVVDSIGNGLFLSLTLVFFIELTDVPLGLLGLLCSLANGLTLPIPILTGSLTDRWGALPLVIAAQIMQAVGYLSFVWATEPIGIFLALSLVALGVRCFWSSVFTAVADYADGSSSKFGKDTWFAWAGMARTAGLGLGGLVTSLAIAEGSDAAYRSLAYAASLCFAAAAVAISCGVRTPRRPRDVTGRMAGYRPMLEDRPFLALTAINTVFALTSMMLAIGLPAFVMLGLNGPSWLGSAVLAGNTLLLSVLAGPVVRRLVPYRRTRVIITAAGLWAVWCLLFSVLVPDRSHWVIVVLLGATAVFTAAELIHAPVSMALATAIAPVEVRGRYLAAFQYSFTIASMIGPAFFTTLFEVQRGLPWLVLGIINILAIFAMGWLEKRLPASALRDGAEASPVGNSASP
jgi:MFS family permease